MRLFLVNDTNVPHRDRRRDVGLGATLLDVQDAIRIHITLSILLCY